MENREHSYTLGENVNSYSAVENSPEFLLKIESPYGPEIPLLDRYLEKRMIWDLPDGQRMGICLPLQRT